MNSEAAVALLNETLQDEILSHPELPTPPGIAIRLIDLAQSSDADFKKVEDLVALDPAIAGKLMRLANSAFYARERKIESLNEAIGRFGLNGTLTIALSFSLIKAPKSTEECFNYSEHWLRSLASATICRRLSQLCSAGPSDVFYLAALLQDIGVLGLVSARPQFYQKSINSRVTHQRQIAAEIAEFGVDHSVVGSWLLESWNFPQIYIDATLTSHALVETEFQSELTMLNDCVAVSSCLADLWKMPNLDLPAELEYTITEKLKLDDKSIRTLLIDAEAEISEIAEVYGLKQGDDAAISSIISEAKDTITLRMLSADRILTDTNQRMEKLEIRAEELEYRLDHDELTGVRTRAFAYTVLEEAFSSSVDTHTPIALLFVDLDDFKKVNDSFGHGTGDEMLKFAAKTLVSATRENDIVARVGGEEFIVLMLDTEYAQASTICDKIVDDFQNASLQIEGNDPINVTASVGLSVHHGENIYTDMHAFIESADTACYKAKNTGKNRWIF